MESKNTLIFQLDLQIENKCSIFTKHKNDRVLANHKSTLNKNDLIAYLYYPAKIMLDSFSF